MKKIITIVLLLSLILCMSISSFAACFDEEAEDTGFFRKLFDKLTEIYSKIVLFLAQIFIGDAPTPY